MKPRLASLVCSAALALAFAAFAQTISLQGPGDGPKPADLAPLPVLSSGPPQSRGPARDYKPPEGLSFKTTDFVSENVRLTAQWFYASENEGKKLPTVILAHDWGATAADFRDDAVDLARAGFLVMVFDYRGWGESDGRVALAEGRPTAGEAFTGQVRQLRGYIDPWEQAEDWFNAVSFATTQPMADPGRIGLLGAGLSGGEVIYVAAQDPRIRALVSLVTQADLRPSKPYQPAPDKVVAEANAAAGALAAGQAQYPRERARGADGLVGAAVGNKLLRWTPVDNADDVTAPALFVLAEKEELFSNVHNGQMACERVQGPRKMMILPKVTHDAVYGAERVRTVAAAIDWFDKYLKAPGEPTRVPVNRKERERGECNPPPLPPAGEEKKEGSGEGHKSQATSGRFN